MNYIIITSINPPTEAVIKFSRINNHHLIVVGDKKSPTDYKHSGVDFISIDNQQKLNFKLNSKLPFNHYCRKMIGYLKAIKSDAECIIDTDDDNIPYNDWSFPLFEGVFESTVENLGFINIYKAFTPQKIWPRGMPLRLINSDIKWDLKKLYCNVGIWQGLADEDPDVDAIYRLTNDMPCKFNNRPPIVCKNGTISPFNTQNTMIRKELFPLLYLPTTVTFRYTDILRGLVAQPIMWLYGYELGFTSATVFQKRNPHDYFKDFLSEIPMYETTEKVIDLVSDSIEGSKSIFDNLYSAYNSLCQNNIVKPEELDVLEAWLTDLN